MLDLTKLGKTLCVLTLMLCVCSLSSSAFGLNISGFGDIGLGGRAANGTTVPGTGEFGHFIYVGFTADQPITLNQVTFDFTGNSAVAFDGDRNSYNSNLAANNGVTSSLQVFQNLPNSQNFGINALVGFDSGDNLLLGIGYASDNLSFIPTAPDYFGGSLTALFSDGTTLVGNFSQQIDFFNARAPFSTNNNNVPEPSTLLLLCVGIAGTGLLRSRFKK
jgi:hypothetical protein